MAEGKRVLILLTDLLVGGVPGVVRDLSVRLKDQGVEVQVACLDQWGPMADQIQQAGIRVTTLNASGAWDLRVFPRLVKLLRQEKVDVLLSFLVHANVVSAWAKRRLPHLQLVQAIHTTQPRPAWHWLAQKYAARCAKEIIVPSTSVAHALAQRSAIPPTQITVIPNAVDTDAFASITPPPLTTTPWEIGFIGRLDPVKRIPDLIEAIRLLGGAARLHLFGTGEQEELLRHTIDTPDLHDKIILHGRIDHPQEALRMISVLVLPSEAEGLPMVLLEAMAAGVPVVATDAPGICDVVEHEHNGLLTPVGKPAELAEAIRRLAGDPQLRDRLVQGGKTTLQNSYTWSIVLPAYRKVLNV